jgi:hypothetical protein
MQRDHLTARKSGIVANKFLDSTADSIGQDFRNGRSGTKDFQASAQPLLTDCDASKSHVGDCADARRDQPPSLILKRTRTALKVVEIRPGERNGGARDAGCNRLSLRRRKHADQLQRLQKTKRRSAYKERTTSHFRRPQVQRRPKRLAERGGLPEKSVDGCEYKVVFRAPVAPPTHKPRGNIPKQSKSRLTCTSRLNMTLSGAFHILAFRSTLPGPGAFRGILSETGRRDLQFAVRYCPTKKFLLLELAFGRGRPRLLLVGARYADPRASSIAGQWRGSARHPRSRSCAPFHPRRPRHARAFDRRKAAARGLLQANLP